MTTQRELSSRRLAYYEANLNAWIQSALELDRSLLTLSVAGLGLLVTLLTTHNGPNATWLIVVYMSAIACLFLCVVAVLWVFHQNRAVAVEAIKNADRAPGDAITSKASVVAGRLDWVIRIFFAFGALLVAIIAVALVIQSPEEKSMGKEKGPNVVISMDSFNGVSVLAPQSVIKSLSNIHDLAPEPAKTTQTSATSSTTQATVSVAGQSTSTEPTATTSQSDKQK